ncbi:MAG: hypothetical protein ACYS9X_15065 [Planctomycetota bacterium]|jgi:hypothetical protein
MGKRFAAPAVFGITMLAFAGCGVARPSARAAEADADGVAVDETRELVPIEIKLPRAVIIPTRPNGALGIDISRIRKDDWKPRPPFMAPPGVKNVALGRRIAASDEEPIIGDPEQITDGDKEALDGSYVEFGPGTQHVAIDLEEICAVSAVLVWHYHGDLRIYHDVIVQVADDPDFITGVKTIFNNDHDNSSGLGLGSDPEYFDRDKGLLVDAGGVKTRYVRLYSNGSTVDEMNRYEEVEVHGMPVR